MPKSQIQYKISFHKNSILVHTLCGGAVLPPILRPILCTTHSVVELCCLHYRDLFCAPHPLWWSCIATITQTYCVLHTLCGGAVFPPLLRPFLCCTPSVVELYCLHYSYLLCAVHPLWWSCIATITQTYSVLHTLCGGAALH